MKQQSAIRCPLCKKMMLSGEILRDYEKASCHAVCYIKRFGLSQRKAETLPMISGYLYRVTFTGRGILYASLRSVTIQYDGKDKTFTHPLENEEWQTIVLLQSFTDIQFDWWGHKAVTYGLPSMEGWYIERFQRIDDPMPLGDDYVWQHETIQHLYLQRYARSTDGDQQDDLKSPPTTKEE